MHFLFSSCTSHEREQAPQVVTWRRANSEDRERESQRFLRIIKSNAEVSEEKKTNGNFSTFRWLLFLFRMQHIFGLMYGSHHCTIACLLPLHATLGRWRRQVHAKLQIAFEIRLGKRKYFLNWKRVIIARCAEAMARTEGCRKLPVAFTCISCASKNKYRVNKLEIVSGLFGHYVNARTNTQLSIGCISCGENPLPKSHRHRRRRQHTIADYS